MVLMGEQWIIISKFSVLIYIAIKQLEGGFRTIAPNILAILVYITLSMVYYLFDRGLYKRITALTGLLLAIVFVAKLDSLYIFLFPLSVIDLVDAFKPPDLLVFSSLLALVFSQSHWPEYLLLAIMIGLLFIVTKAAEKRDIKLVNRLDQHRKKLDLMQKQIDSYEQYKKQEYYLVQLEERNSIAQQIHDKVGHSISSSLIQLEAAQLVSEQDPAMAKKIISKVTGVLREGMESIRQTLHNIKPAVEQLGINRVKSILDEFRANSMIRVNLTDRGDLSLISYQQWKVISDNLTEALTNSLKHSRATDISVSISVLNKIIKLEVKDNGVGVSRINKGLGLAGIDERTASIGGKAIFDGSRGFSVITILPIGGADELAY